jgi:hypothetical protein
MSPSLRAVSTSMRLACALILTVSPGAPRAAEEHSCRLSFNLPEGTVLHFVDFTQMEQNFGGSDVTFNQTSDVDMSSTGKTEEGNCRVDLAFIKVKSSVVSNNQLMDWTPPIKLEGATIKVVVSPAGDVVRFEPGRNIQGLHDVNDLRDVVDPWFVKLPDSTVAVGQSWTKEIVEGEKEGAEPAVKGEAVFTLKKIEKKGSLDVAIVEGKANLKMNSETPGGTLIADGKANIKAQIAVPGGYIVELKEDLDIRGNTVATDPLTDKETKRETAVSVHVEIKQR